MFNSALQAAGAIFQAWLLARRALQPFLTHHQVAGWQGKAPSAWASPPSARRLQRAGAAAGMWPQQLLAGTGLLACGQAKATHAMEIRAWWPCGLEKKKKNTYLCASLCNEEMKRPS